MKHNSVVTSLWSDQLVSEFNYISLSEITQQIRCHNNPTTAHPKIAAIYMSINAIPSALIQLKGICLSYY